MTTDLQGRLLRRPPDLQLNLWQKRQATLIDYFASLDYLKGLLTRIEALIEGADVSLDTAFADGRDRFIANPRWGTRDTAANYLDMHRSCSLRAHYSDDPLRKKQRLHIYNHWDKWRLQSLSGKKRVLAGACKKT